MSEATAAPIYTVALFEIEPAAELYVELCHHLRIYIGVATMPRQKEGECESATDAMTAARIAEKIAPMVQRVNWIAYPSGMDKAKVDNNLIEPYTDMILVLHREKRLTGVDKWWRLLVLNIHKAHLQHLCLQQRPATQQQQRRSLSELLDNQDHTNSGWCHRPRPL